MSFASAVDKIVVGTRKERRRREEEEEEKVKGEEDEEAEEEELREEEEGVGARGIAFLLAARTFTHVKKGDKK